MSKGRIFAAGALALIAGFALAPSLKGG